MQHSSRFLHFTKEIQAHVEGISHEDLLAMLANPPPKFFLVDVREKEEYDPKHLPGAIHLSKGVIERDIEARIPDPHAYIVLYCSGGFRSALAAYNLEQMGYLRVFSLEGGCRSWFEKGLPAE